VRADAVCRRRAVRCAEHDHIGDSFPLAFRCPQRQRQAGRIGDQDGFSSDARGDFVNRSREEPVARAISEIEEEACAGRPIADRLEPGQQRQQRKVAAEMRRHQYDRLAVAVARGTADQHRLPRDGQGIEGRVGERRRQTEKPLRRRDERVEQRRRVAIDLCRVGHVAPVFDVIQEAGSMRDAFVGRFPHHAVAAAGNDDQARAANEARNLPRVLRRDQPVEIAGQDQRRLADRRELLRAVELGERLELQIGDMQRRRQRDLAPHLLLGKLTMLFEIAGRVGHAPDSPRRLFRRETVEIAHDADHRRLGIGRARPARHGRTQDQAFDAIGELPDEFLRDRPAHGIAEHVDLIEFQFVEQPADVARHVRDRIALDRPVASSCAAIVQRDDSETLRQLFNEGGRPRRRTEPIAHDQHERRPVALHLEGNVDAIHAGETCGHSVFLSYSPETKCPPSTATTLPVMKEPALEINSSSGPSSSLSWPRRRCGTRLISAWPRSLSKKSSFSSVAK